MSEKSKHSVEQKNMIAEPEEIQAENISDLLEEQIAIFKTLSRNFKNLYFVNIFKETAKVLKYDGEYPYGDIESFGKNEFPYVELLNEWIGARVHVDDRDMLRKALSPEHLREVFASRDEYVGNYRMDIDGKIINYQFNLSKADIDGYIIAGFQNIDGIIAEHLEQEKKQRETEKKYQAQVKEQLMVFDTLARNFKNVYFVDLEKETARILKLDATYVDVPGKNDHRVFPFAAVLSQWINTVVCPEDRERIRNTITVENVKKALETQNEFVGNYRSLVNGEIHHFQYSFSKADKDGTKTILGFQSTDDIIAEHLATEKAEREKEAAHQKELNEQLAIIDTLSKTFRNVYVANMDTGMARAIRLADSYNVRAIRDVANMTFPFDAVVNRWLIENVHPDDKEKMREILNLNYMKKALSERDEIVGNYRNMEDGVQHHYQFDIRRIGNTENVVAGFQIIDSIIEEQEAKQKREYELEQAHLRDEKEHNEIIASLSTIYSTIIKVDLDTRDYEVFASIPYLYKVCGKYGNYEDKKDVFISAFVDPETGDQTAEFLDFDTLADRMKEHNTIASEYKAPDGRWKQMRFIVKRRDNAGVAKEALYVVRDITDEKNRELRQQETLTHALAAARQASKAKTTFLNSMSHDIRTPMNAIIGFTSLAQTHIKNEELVQDYLGKISTSSTHLLNLINDILDMSRIESGAVKLDEKPVHIPDLVYDLKTMVQGLVSTKNLALKIDSQGIVHEDVITDKLRVNQVLLNIVSNAVKFTPSGGEISIRIAEKPCSTMFYATYELSVKDNGIGMSKEFQGHIFETFTREYSSTVSGTQGTGLGMAITKNIVDMMGGNIKVESEVGKGSLFTVTFDLRIADEPVVSAKTAKEDNKTYDFHGKRVLLVEDNELNREIATALLQETGMIVDSVEDGDVAVATINREPADKYDLVLMDVQMPRMDGYTATREIRTLPDNKKANIPIVAMTANAFEEDKRKALESGMNDHIIKPISIEAIADVLDDIFAKKE